MKKAVFALILCFAFILGACVSANETPDASDANGSLQPGAKVNSGKRFSSDASSQKNAVAEWILPLDTDK